MSVILTLIDISCLVNMIVRTAHLQIFNGK